MTAGGSDQVKENAGVNKPIGLSSPGRKCAVENGIKTCVTSDNPHDGLDGSVILAELDVSNEDGKRGYCIIEFRRQGEKSFARFFITISGYKGRRERIVDDPLGRFKKLLYTLRTIIRAGNGPEGVPSLNGAIASLIKEVMERAYGVEKPQQQGENEGSQGVELPEKVHEGENDRFTASREFDYDNGVFTIVIKDHEQPEKEATIMFRLVRAGLTKVRTHVSVYSGGKVVLEGHGLSVTEILKQIRKELNTKAIKNDGPIADFLGRIYSMVIEEAEKVRRELIKQLRKKLFNELRGNQELLNNPLQYIITKVLSIVHFGDEIAKKAGVLGIVSSRLPHKKRVNVAITGPSSSGKSNLLEALSELIPKSWIQGGRVFAYSSPKAIFYEGERQVRGNVVEHRINVAHKVIVYIEPTPFYTRSDETIIGRELLKLLLSDAKEGRPLCHKAVDADSKVTRYYCIEGKPVVITTLPDEYVQWLAEQEVIRLLPVSVDLNPETERAVFEFMLNEDEEQEKQFKQAALLVRFFLSLLPVVKSVRLSDDAKEVVRDTLGRYIGDTKTKRHIRRALRDLVGLAAAYELLNYTASLIREGKEVPKVLDKLIVTGKSIKYVWDLVGDAIVGKAFGRPFEAQEKRILRIIENAGGAMKRKDIIEAMNPLHESTIKRLLNRLVEDGVLNRCGKRTGLYALPGKCPESDQITKYTQEEQEESKDQGEGEQ
jgi:energy-coupling factor transporter ATP-binding protein EcfA2